MVRVHSKDRRNKNKKMLWKVTGREEETFMCVGNPVRKPGLAEARRGSPELQNPGAPGHHDF